MDLLATLILSPKQKLMFNLHLETNVINRECIDITEVTLILVGTCWLPRKLS